MITAEDKGLFLTATPLQHEEHGVTSSHQQPRYPMHEHTACTQRRIQLVSSAGGGAISLIFGNQVSFAGSLLWDRWSIHYNTAVTKQWTTKRHCIANDFFSELYKIIVNEVTFVGFRVDRPNRRPCVHLKHTTCTCSTSCALVAHLVHM